MEFGKQAEQAEEIYQKIAAEWGAWRRFIARRPLTATWIMFGIGSALGWLAGRLHLPF